MTYTIGMIKPDAVANGSWIYIIQDIENAGFIIHRAVKANLRREDAEALYEEHRGRDHFSDLIDFTVSGPVHILEITHSSKSPALEFRKLMGPTKLELAKEGTLRHKYATDYRRNAIHGSDSDESAIRELNLFNHYFG